MFLVVLLAFVLFILFAGVSASHAASIEPNSTYGMEQDSADTCEYDKQSSLSNVEANTINDYDNYLIKEKEDINSNMGVDSNNNMDEESNNNKINSKLVNNKVNADSINTTNANLANNPSKTIKQATTENELNLSCDDISCYVNDDVEINVLTEPAGITDGILSYYVNQELIGMHNLSFEPANYEFNTEGYDSGTYTIKVDYSGSLIYQNTQAYSTLTINKLPTKLADIATTYDENNNLNLSFNILANDKKVDSGTVSVYKDDTLIGSLEAAGEDLNMILPNTYNYEVLTFVYNDEYYYDNLNTSELIHVDKLDVEMYLPSLYGYHSSIISSAVVFYNDSIINDGYLYLYVDDVIIKEYEVSSDSVDISIDLSGYLEGKYNVVLEYLDSNVYNPATYNTSLQVNKIKTTMYLSNITAYRNSIVDLKAYVYNYIDDTNEGIVEFLIDDESIETTIINNNSAVVEYLIPDNLEYGKHNLSVIYHGTDRYDQAESTSALTINKYSNKVSIRNTTIDSDGLIVLNIRSYSYNHTVDDGVISVYVDGNHVKTVNVTSNNTQVTLPGEYALNKEYNVTIYYGNSSWYNDSEVSKNISVNKINTTLRIYNYLSNKNILSITTYVYAKNYANINEGTVEFYLNDALIDTSTITNNTSNTAYDMTNYDEGTYDITVKYSGSKIYDSSLNTTSFNRTIQQTKIYITASSKITANPNDTITINATLNDYEGNAINETVPTKIIIDNQTIETEFNNGILTYEYNIPGNATQQTSTIQIITSSTKYYKGAAKNITFTIKKNTTYISGYSNLYATKLESITINATLYSNKELVTVKTPALIKINNKTAYNGYFVDGRLQFNLSLLKYTKDSYEITIIAQQTTQFKESTKTINLTLNKRATYILSENAYSKKGDKILFNATIVDQITKNPIIGTTSVCLKINSLTQNVSKITNGHFVFEYLNNLNLAQYNITILFGENQIYKASTWNGLLINNKLNLKVSTQSINTKVNTTININANILDNGQLATGTIPVAIKIDDNTIANMNVTDGKINYTYKLSEKYSGKKHTINIITGETGKYTYSNTTASLIITKEYRTINATAINATKGSTIHIKAKIYDSNGNLATLNTPVNIKIGNKNIVTYNVTGGIIDYEYKLEDYNKGYYDILIQAGETSFYHHVTKHAVLKVT